MNCANSTAIETFISREMFVNYFFHQSASSLSNITLLDCAAHCMDENKFCAVAVLMDQRCEWYLSSASYSYGSAIAVGKNKRTTIRLCPIGIYIYLS